MSSQIPQFDNFYLDMNGIIHKCSHPNNDDVHFRISEEDIFKNIFRYLDHLFALIKPKKIMFMAVDGVAPRAKMNQQRSRRFRTAQEADRNEAAAIKRGEELPTESRFDSNCITPGTEFMQRLQTHLEYFVADKISNDPLWQPVQVYLSGHLVPGEGEHKIMDFIRYLRLQPTYDVTDKHCFYGLDADLILLGMITHEPYVSLLREEVLFKTVSSESSKKLGPENTKFFLLHLSILRDYLSLEFEPIRNTLPFTFHLESLIDDWILMNLLIGNDFIPHLPGFHLKDGVSDLLIQIYGKVLPNIGGYINEGGCINLKRLNVFLSKLGEYEEQQFLSKQSDLERMQTFGNSSNAKSNGNSKSTLQDLTPFFEDNDEIAEQLLEDDDNLLLPDSDRNDSTSDSFEAADISDFTASKHAYYRQKLKIEPTEENLRAQALTYVTALQWNLRYYYQGCPSWSWFYPFHYAPYVSDVRDVMNLGQVDKFEMSQPFKPFQQLLAVLPIASKHFLPESYQDLMVNEKSPLAGFYPTDFVCDKHEKKQDWEAVVLLPFIDANLLIDASQKADQKLSVYHRSLNVLGNHLLYTYSPKRQAAIKSPNPAAFVDLLANHSICRQLPVNAFYVNREELELANQKTKESRNKVIIASDKMYYGLPRLRFCDYTFEIKETGVRVFEGPSRNANLIIKLTSNPLTPDLLIDRIGKPVFYDWPFLKYGILVEVYTTRMKHNRKGSHELTGNKLQALETERKTSALAWKQKRGVEWKDPEPDNVSMVAILPYKGRYLEWKAGLSRFVMESKFDLSTVIYPVETIVFDLKYASEIYNQPTNKSDVNTYIEKMFAKNTRCFSLNPRQYGDLGKVEACEAEKSTITVRMPLTGNQVFICVNKLCQLPPIVQQYLHFDQAAIQLDITTDQLFRVTGNAWINSQTSNRLNLGLNIRNQRILCSKVRTDFYISPTLVTLIQEYRDKFPRFFELVTTCDNSQLEQQLTQAKNAPQVTGQTKTNGKGNGISKEISAYKDWIRNITRNLFHPIRDGKMLDPLYIPQIQAALDDIGTIQAEIKQNPKTYRSLLDGKSDTTRVKQIVRSERVDRVFVPCYQNVRQVPVANEQFCLFDLVVNVRSGLVPVGLRGVIVGIKSDNPISKNQPSCALNGEMYTIWFEQDLEGGFPLFGTDRLRAFSLPDTALLNISRHRVLEPKKAHSEMSANNDKPIPNYCTQNHSKKITSKNTNTKMTTAVVSNKSGLPNKPAVTPLPAELPKPPIEWIQSDQSLLLKLGINVKINQNTKSK